MGYFESHKNPEFFGNHLFHELKNAVKSKGHLHTIESLNNLIALYEAWNKPEEAEKWRAKFPQTEAERE